MSQNPPQKIHIYEIDYDIIVEGQRHPRTAQFKGFTPDIALINFKEECKKTITSEYAEYFVKGDPRLIR